MDRLEKYQIERINWYAKKEEVKMDNKVNPIILVDVRRLAIIVD